MPIARPFSGYHRSPALPRNHTRTGPGNAISRSPSRQPALSPHSQSFHKRTKHRPVPNASRRHRLREMNGKPGHNAGEKRFARDAA
jgi:hypothetical protein